MRHLREADGRPVRGPDQGQAGKRLHPHPHRRRGQREDGGVPGGESQGGQGDSGQGHDGQPGQGGGEKGQGVRAAEKRPGVRADAG